MIRTVLVWGMAAMVGLGCSKGPPSTEGADPAASGAVEGVEGGEGGEGEPEGHAAGPVGAESTTETSAGAGDDGPRQGGPGEEEAPQGLNRRPVSASSQPTSLRSPEETTSATGRRLPRAWRTCETAAQCVQVSTVCCACDLGDYMTVNEEYRSAARLRFQPTACEQGCPSMDCEAIDTECISGRCVSHVRGTAYEGLRNGYYITRGSPDPVTCDTVADCLGDTVLGADGCCRDPYEVRPHSRAYSRWMAERAAGPACADVTCPPPPNPAQPAECLFQMQCNNNECLNTCPTFR